MISKSKWGGEIFLSHRTEHSKGVCILSIHALKLSKTDYGFNSNTERMMLHSFLYQNIFSKIEAEICEILSKNKAEAEILKRIDIILRVKTSEYNT